MLLEDTQSALIEACRRGDTDAQRSLFNLHKDRVYTIALRYSGDAATAEDVTQESFVKLFAAIGKFRGESGFESWLYRLVVNACFDQKRKTRRLLPLVDAVVAFLKGPGRSPLEDLLQTEQSSLLRDSIARLDPEYRMVVVLRYSLGLPYDEIATILDCPAGTVASRLNRAHSILERRLKGKVGRRLA